MRALGASLSRRIGRLRWIEELVQDGRFAVRLLSHERRFFGAVVVVLAVGIAVTGTFFTLMNAIVLRGLPIKNVDRIADISTRDSTGREQRLSYADLGEVRAASKSFRALAAFVAAPMSVSDDRQPAERFSGAYVTAGTLTLMGEVPVAGRDLRPEDDHQGASPVVVIGRSLWQRRYAGREALIGQSVRVNGLLATVVGIMPERSRFPTNAEVWLPLAQLPGLFDRNRNARNLSVMGWLSNVYTVQGADDELRAIAVRLQEQYPDTNRGIRIEAVPVNDQYMGSATQPAWIAFIIAGALVLLIACANVANLMLMRSISRAREMAVRVSLGATRSRIVRQLLGESLVLALVGGATGLALAFAWTRALTTLMPRDTLPYWMLPTIDGRVLVTVAAVCVSTTIVFGLVPALHASNTRPSGVLKEGGRSTGQGVRTGRLTTSFLLVQFALSMIFLAHIALNIRGARSNERRDPPMEMTRLLTASISLPDRPYETAVDRLRFYRALESRLREIGDVSSASVTTSLPLGGAPARSFDIEGWPTSSKESEQSAQMVSIGTQYFSTLQVPLVRGRDFRTHDAERGEDAAIINQRFADTYFPKTDPIGRRIRLKIAGSALSKSWLTVIGVSQNVRQRATPDRDPVIYVPYPLDPPALVSVIVRGPRGPDAITPALRQAVRELDPDLPLYQLMTLEGAVAKADWNSRFSNLLITTITIIAVVLAAVGLYAVTAHAIALRIQELGVRIALGAGPAHLLWLLLRRAVVQLCAGLAIGVAAVFVWSRFLPGSIGSVRLTDVEGLAMAGAVMAMLGLIGSFVPAVRALRLNPVVALRYE